MAARDGQPEQPHENATATRRRRGVYIAAGLIAVCTILFHIHSYWWSVSLTLCDVRLRTDEGLVSLLIPLVRIAANEKPVFEFLVYERGPQGWTAGNAGSTPLRNWMARLDEIGADGLMFADFGYWKGGWQSKSRPGAFIVLFVPIWFVGVALLGAYLAFHFNKVRFRLRTLLIVITLAACVLFLLTLKADA